MASAWLFLLVNLDLGWLPNDDGTLAHAADRVLAGEIPHVDFDEPYTGGLSYLNAAALWAFGNDLLSLRYPLLALTGLWMACLYGMVRRVVDEVASAAVVASMAIGALFMHLTPMPTWYLMMLGTLALYCVLRFEESGSRPWLFSAGLFVGLSVLIKSSGLLFLVAVGSVLAVSAVRTRRRPDMAHGRTLLALAIGAITVFVATSPSYSRFLLLVVPLVLLVAAEWPPGPGSGPSEDGAESSGRHPIPLLLGVVLLGVMVSVAPYLAFYWGIGGWDALWSGVGEVPSLYIGDIEKDIGDIENELPGIHFALEIAVIGLIIWRLGRWTSRGRRLALVSVVSIGIAWYLVSPGTLILTGFTFLVWLPLFVAGGYYALRRLRPATVVSPVVLILSAGALVFQLVRFPTDNLYYTIHALPPLAAALVVVVFVLKPFLGRGAVLVLVLFAVIMAAAKLEGRLFAMGVAGEPAGYVTLEPGRGGVRVAERFAYFNDLIPTLQALHEDGDVLLAGPDSPEIYYLSGIDNPTPVFFDFLSAGKGGVGTARLLWTLEPDIFVNHTSPPASDALDPTLPASACSFVGEFDVREVYTDCGTTSAGHRKVSTWRAGPPGAP